VSQSPHWLQWDAPNSLPKLPLPLRRSRPPSNTPIPQPTPLTIPTASGSTQPFCHNKHCRQTDKQTDRHTDRQIARGPSHKPLTLA